MTTHNMHEAAKLCDKIFLLNEGTIVEQGVPKEICMKYNTENTLEILLEDGTTRMLPNNRESASALLDFCI